MGATPGVIEIINLHQGENLCLCSRRRRRLAFHLNTLPRIVVETSIVLTPSEKITLGRRPIRTSRLVDAIPGQIESKD